MKYYLIPFITLQILTAANELNLEKISLNQKKSAPIAIPYTKNRNDFYGSDYCSCSGPQTPSSNKSTRSNTPYGTPKD